MHWSWIHDSTPPLGPAPDGPATSGLESEKSQQEVGNRSWISQRGTQDLSSGPCPSQSTRYSRPLPFRHMSRRWRPCGWGLHQWSRVEENFELVIVEICGIYAATIHETWGWLSRNGVPLMEPPWKDQWNEGHKIPCCMRPGTMWNW